MNRKEKARIKEENVEKWVPTNQRRLRSLTGRLIAIVCALAIWFSSNVGDSLQAAPSNHWISVPTIVSDTASGVSTTVGVADSLLVTSSGIAILTSSLIALTLIGYSLLTTGKRGWGWATLCLAGGALMIFVRLATALFQEVSSDNGIQDWDT